NPAPRPRQLAAGNALDGDLHRAGRQDQGQRAVDSRGFRDGDGAQDLRRGARRHEAGLGGNHGPVRRIPGTSEMTVKEKDLVLTRVSDAPRERVWKAWTDPRQIAQWWGPAGFTNPRCEVDVRPGGVLRIDMRGPDGTVYPMAGVYREVVAPERLVFTGSALDEKGKPLFEVLNTVIFAEQGGKTKLTIKAPPEKIFPLINDLQRWGAWSPYEKRDPAMKRTFGATTTGKGAVYEWDGNRSVGKGRMEITDTAPPSTIVIKLDFIAPFEGH